ncbi:hypothetical protein halTADL_1077 [Halohasta litchfieldiae]|jgi:peptidoglycan hydrolase CwlO-like protein|uniref:BZIP transcription factor n=1 Tax=Halohasta litchfieldiae TaxID=1073996 RepID=A0A1H6SGM3_9EURY|nr:hypothetical protein [Halohasta litchfieldiae]ATW87871.1 hypothetical protein halTADL_1077 [Halohasta litchfieldiae]SEI63230.1 hypothetical protein SAMN05444271_104120 [Halohasta litchfieldiae]
MTNRVDDLESEIAELRAAVNGLTEELVETKARVRELENEADAEPEPEESTAETDFVDADPVAPTSETTKSDDHVEVVEQEPSNEEGATSFEADNPDETKESTEDDETVQGDIIVA